MSHTEICVVHVSLEGYKHSDAPQHDCWEVLVHPIFQVAQVSFVQLWVSVRYFLATSG